MIGAIFLCHYCFHKAVCTATLGLPLTNSSYLPSPCLTFANFSLPSSLLQLFSCRKPVWLCDQRHNNPSLKLCRTYCHLCFSLKLLVVWTQWKPLMNRASAPCGLDQGYLNSRTSPVLIVDEFPIHFLSGSLVCLPFEEVLITTGHWRCDPWKWGWWQKCDEEKEEAILVTSDSYNKVLLTGSLIMTVKLIVNLSWLVKVSKSYA